MQDPIIHSRYRQFKKILKWLALAVLVLGVLAGIWRAGHFVLEKLERRQSRQLTESAAKDLVEGRVREAHMALETATRLDSGNARALRMLARIQQAQGEETAALESMRQLSEAGGLAVQDLVGYSMLAMNQGDFALARRLADVASTGNNPALRSLMLAQVAVRENKPAEAELAYREAVAVDRSGLARLELARFLISKGLTPETTPEVREILREQSRSPDKKGAKALAMGLASGVVPLVEGDAWIVAIRSHPAADARLRLAADRAEAHLHPKTKSQVAERTLARLSSRPWVERAEAMRWAADIGEPLVAVALIAPDEAVKDAGVFTVWLEALSQLDQWQDMPLLLEKNKTPTPAYLARLFEGRALVDRGDAKSGREAWEQALAEARVNEADFPRAVVFLGAVGERDVFEQAFREALEKEPAARDKILRAVMPAVANRKEAARSLEVFEIAAPLPGATAFDPALQNERDYLAVLVGRPVDTEAIGLRVESSPGHFPFRATQALALLKEDRADEALQVLEECEPDVHVALLPPSLKMVVAAAFASTGKLAEARQVAGTIPSGTLAAEESEFLSDRLEKAATAPRIPNSTAGFRPKPKSAKDPEPALEGIPNPTQKAIEEALQNPDPATDAPGDSTKRAIAEALETVKESGPASMDATQKALLEARRDAAEEDRKDPAENPAQP